MRTDTRVKTYKPTGFTTGDVGGKSSGFTITSGENACNFVENESSYAQFRAFSAFNIGTQPYARASFGITDIPQGASVNNVTCLVRVANASPQGGGIYPAVKLGSFSTSGYSAAQNISASAPTVYTLTYNNVAGNDLPNIGLYLGADSVIATAMYVMQFNLYGATLSVSYNTTVYSIACSSTSQNITLTSSSNEVDEGGSVTYTLTAPNISTVKVLDNGVDITSNFTGSNGVYTCTVNNISADHNVVASLTCSLSIKLWGGWQTPQQIYVKGRNSWYAMEDYSYRVLSELLPKDRIYKTEKLDDQGQE